MHFTVGRWAVPALIVVALTCGGCATSATGRAIRAPGEPMSAKSLPSARDLLLQNGDTTPLGPASAVPAGASYFTSVRPPECSAALLFEGSPLRPPGSSDHAEASYGFGSRALYAESIDLYDKALNVGDVVRKSFSAVSDCHGDAFGTSAAGEFPAMRLSYFATLTDGVLVWTMTRPDWTCDYGLAAIPQVALLISVCDAKPGFPMADWAAKRKAQLGRQSA
jgi:hypothetical protein